MRSAGNSAGFTLVELLVALAIFMVIMGSLAMMLSGAANTASQGYALMAAMEKARGAMSVLESDLKTAFSSREKSQYFQFYGEPNGFMYSGQLYNGGFGRVTYAVHADNSRAQMQGTDQYEQITLSLPWGSVALQFARILCPVSPANAAFPNIDKNSDGAHDIAKYSIGGATSDVLSPAPYLSAWNVIDAADEPRPKNGFSQYAAALFAGFYPVPAEAQADFNYPLDFTLRVQRGVLLRYEERGQGTLSEFSNPIMTGLFASSDGQTSLVSPFGSALAAGSVLAQLPASTGEKLDRLQQNHYWVRMLTGNLPLNGTVDPFTPHPAFWLEDGGSSGLSWRKYVVTEGILVSAGLVFPDSDQVIMGVDNALGGALVTINALDLSSFFSYGIEDGSDRKLFNTLWNMTPVALPGGTGGARPIFNYFLFGTTDQFADALRVQVYDYAPGDPLKPRQPAWVAPGFWIFGDPPRSGAPPFHQWFQQKVDIPSAYLRGDTGT